jgi:hypothetical protein
MARRSIYTGQITILNERLKLRDDQAGELQRKIKAESPADALIKIGELSAKVEGLALGIWDALTDEQADRLQEKLSALAPGTVYLEISEPFARALGHRLAKIFKLSGWQVDGGRVMGEVDTGIQISSANADRANAVANALRSSAGLDAEVKAGGGGPQNIELHLGEKPFS